MSTYISNLVHFVWGTANREPLIRKSWRDQLHAYIGGILENKKAKLIAAGGIEDHMHVFASLPATISLSEAAGAMKANSSRWIHENILACSPKADPVVKRVITHLGGCEEDSGCRRSGSGIVPRKW